MFENRITAMHATQLVLALTCLIMHFSAEKWVYEYQFDPLFSLTFVGCTVMLLAIVIVDSLRLDETWDRDQIELHYLIRTEIIFDFVAAIMFVACGTVNIIYDNRPETLVKGALSIITAICFLLDAIICNQCKYRWGEELAADRAERINERRAFYHLAYPTRTHYV